MIKKERIFLDSFFLIWETQTNMPCSAMQWKWEAWGGTDDDTQKLGGKLNKNNFEDGGNSFYFDYSKYIR